MKSYWVCSLLVSDFQVYQAWRQWLTLNRQSYLRWRLSVLSLLEPSIYWRQVLVLLPSHSGSAADLWCKLKPRSEVLDLRGTGCTGFECQSVANGLIILPSITASLGTRRGLDWAALLAREWNSSHLCLTGMPYRGGASASPEGSITENYCFLNGGCGWGA